MLWALLIEEGIRGLRQKSETLPGFLDHFHRHSGCYISDNIVLSSVFINCFLLFKVTPIFSHCQIIASMNAQNLLHCALHKWIEITWKNKGNECKKLECLRGKKWILFLQLIVVCNFWFLVVVFGLFYMKTGFKCCISCFLEICGTVFFYVVFTNSWLITELKSASKSFAISCWSKYLFSISEHVLFCREKLPVTNVQWWVLVSHWCWLRIKELPKSEWKRVQ